MMREDKYDSQGRSWGGGGGGGTFVWDARLGKAFLLCLSAAGELFSNGAASFKTGSDKASSCWCAIYSFERSRRRSVAGKCGG